MSVARFIAVQRTNYRVPHTVTCVLLGVSLAWFYKWLGRANGPSATSGLHTPRDRRRDAIDRAVKVMFTKKRGLHGSPRLHADLRDDGWAVSEKTVADSMRRQGLVARRIKLRNGLTKQDRTAPKFPDLVKRNFTAEVPDAKWVGDMTEIPTVDKHGRPGPKLYLATVIDLFSRRLLVPPRGCTQTPTWRVLRSRWPWPLVVEGRRSGGRTSPSGSSFTRTEARPTRRTRSPSCVASRRSVSRWAESGRVSTMPLPRRFSPPWSGRSCPGTTSRTPARPRPLCSTGVTGSTTMIVDTAQPA